MAPVRVGILGFAHSHVNAYCARWRKEEALGVRVTAGWDPDAARSAQSCATHGAAACGSAAELLRRPDVDAVVVAAETSRHADLVEQAAAAGKPIVLQKPLALTPEQADRIVAAVARTGVPFTLAWQMRVDRHNLQLKSLLEGGRFGKVHLVRRRHCLSTQLMKDFESSWHNQPALNRDIFADDASHAMDFLYWLRGMPVSVVAEMGTLRNPKIVHDTAVSLFRFADGSFGEISCSFASVGGETTCEIVCENGLIVGVYGDAPSTTVRPPGAPQLKWYLPSEGRWTASDLPEYRSQSDRIAGLAGPLAEFLQGRRPPIATAEEGRDVLRMTLACYESAEQGRRVLLRR